MSGIDVTLQRSRLSRSFPLAPAAPAFLLLLLIGSSPAFAEEGAVCDLLARPSR